MERSMDAPEDPHNPSEARIGPERLRARPAPEAPPENAREIEAGNWRALLDSNQWPSASELVIPTIPRSPRRPVRSCYARLPRLCAKGALPHVRVGSLLRIDVDAYLAAPRSRKSKR